MTDCNCAIAVHTYLKSDRNNLHNSFGQPHSDHTILILISNMPVCFIFTGLFFLNCRVESFVFYHLFSVYTKPTALPSRTFGLLCSSSFVLVLLLFFWFDWSHHRHTVLTQQFILVRGRSVWATNYCLVNSLHLRIIEIKFIGYNNAAQKMRWPRLTAWEFHGTELKCKSYPLHIVPELAIGSRWSVVSSIGHYSLCAASAVDATN